MTPIEDVITRNTDAILDALQARLSAQPLDAEMQAMFEHANRTLRLVLPDPLPVATPATRDSYKATLATRRKDLPAMFRNAGSPQRALQLLITGLLSMKLLHKTHYLTLEDVSDLQDEMVAMYAVYAPLETLQ